MIFPRYIAFNSAVGEEHYLYSFEVSKCWNVERRGQVRVRTESEVANSLPIVLGHPVFVGHGGFPLVAYPHP